MLTPEESRQVAQAVADAGINPSRLRNENPWSIEGDTPTARSVRMAVQVRYPALAARLAAAAGHQDGEVSLGLAAAMADPDFSPSHLSRGDYARWAELHPEQARAAAEAEEQALLAKWDNEARQMAADAGVNPDAKTYAGRWSSWQRDQDQLTQAGL